MTPRARVRLALCAALAGCSPSTSGGLIRALPVLVGGAARDAGIDSPYFFDTQGDGGFRVELDQAVVTVGPFYFNVQPPETQTLESGVVIIQFTNQVLVDLLDPTLYDAGFANGETGQAVSVEVDLFPPDGTNQAYDPVQFETYTQFLSTSTAYVAGTARRNVGDGGIQALPFSGFITIDSSLVSPNDPGAKPLAFLQRANTGVCPNGAGAGCVCSGASDAGAGGCALAFTIAPQVLTASIDPAAWFAGLDFGSLLPSPSEDAGASCPNNPNANWPDSGEPLTWCVDSAFNAQLVNGLHAQSGAYLFTLLPQSP